MALLTLEVPDQFMIIPQAERNNLLKIGLTQAISFIVKQLKDDIEKTKRDIALFEKRYSSTFSEFETNLLPNLETLEAHEDYNDWFFLERVLSEKQQSLLQLEQV